MRALIIAIMSVFISPLILDMARAQSRPSNAEVRSFAEMDANGDDMIQRREWRRSPQSFTGHDWHGNGVLSVLELSDQ